MQVATSAPARSAEAEELKEESRVGKQGWGQTKVHDVLQTKVLASERSYAVFNLLAERASCEHGFHTA